MNKEEFKEYLNKLNININDEIMNQLDIYYKYLVDYNSHTNLTAITEEKDVYLKHFYDSILVASYYDFNKVNNLIDVGTGAGFPGVILKIFFPNIEVTLLDSNNKKITFLNNLIKKLNLKGIKTVQTRSEEYALANLDSYDVVIARAVKNLPELVELCLPLVKVNGYFISLKGHVDEELELAKSGIQKLNGKVERIEKLKLPKEEAERNIIFINKIDKTPKGYPRRYDQIVKKPL